MPSLSTALCSLSWSAIPRVAYQVMTDENAIDDCENGIDSMATSLIALEQPVAGDMRLVVAAIKISTDLERMGDLAVGTSPNAACR